MLARDLAGYPTPSLHVDAPVVRRNIERMARYAQSQGLLLRPHTKTHKSLRIAEMQLLAGACGLTVAKVGEAEVMAEVCRDILLAYPTVDMHRCQRVAQLAHRITMRVALDSELAAANLQRAAADAGATVGVLVDVDLGYGRTGVQSDDAALQLAGFIKKAPALRLDGIMTYTGHVSGGDAEQQAAFQRVEDRLAGLLARWRDAGFSTEVISGGSTPSALHCHLARYFTEIRPGTYIYNDMNTVRGGYCTLDDCAARVLATVVSDTVPGQVVLDCGSKTLTSDRCGPAPDSGHGYILEYPEARIAKLTEEHAQVDVSRCARRPVLGEQVAIVPNHICVCVNMQQSLWWHDGEDVHEPMPVDARGLLV
jgi:D-serine deaminase-like pyridoxal phosphate-dependent protein